MIKQKITTKQAHDLAVIKIMKTDRRLVSRDEFEDMLARITQLEKKMIKKPNTKSA